MYQPKVTNVEQYSDSQGKHVVTPAKLLLLAVSNPKGNHSLWRNKSGQLLHTKTSSPEQLTALKPIFISETEEIENGDHFYSEVDKGISIAGVTMLKMIKKASKPSYKILALPEHFSDKHLQVIAEGKIKNGDKALIKCLKEGKDYYRKGDMGTFPSRYEFKVHLDRQNHITLFPTKKSFEEAYYSYFGQKVEHSTSTHDSYEVIAFAEWTKKNNY